MTGVRLPADLRARIDQWRGLQADQPSLAEAIRRLIARGLVNPGP